MKNILVSGTNGFLGRAFANLLKDIDQNFLPFDRQKSKIEDIDADAVVHIAALVSYEVAASKALFDGNVLLTQKLADAFGQKRFIHASSVAVYSQFPFGTANEQTPPCTQSPYGLSKLWAEQFVKSLPNFAIIRFSSLYGPGMAENTIIPKFVSQALTKKVIEVWGNGSRKQNYVHVQDAANLLYHSLLSNETGVFLGTGAYEISNLELAEMIASFTHSKIKFINSDNSLSSYYNNDLTQNTLNWKPAISFEDGLGQYIEWKKGQL